MQISGNYSCVPLVTNPQRASLQNATADFPGDFLDELVQRFRAKVVLGPVADGNGAMGKSSGCEWFNAHLTTALDSVANTEPFAGMHLDAGRRELVPQAVDGMGTRAMTKDHPPWSQRMQRGDRAIHAFGRGGGEMQPADERIDGKFSCLLENVIEGVDRAGVGAAEDHG